MNNMYHISADKRKRKYGFINNMIFFVGCIWKWSKPVFFMQFLFFIPNVITMLLTDLMPAMLVSKLAEKAELSEVITTIFVILVGILVFSTCSNIFSGCVNTNYDYFPDFFTVEFTKAVSHVDCQTAD